MASLNSFETDMRKLRRKRKRKRIVKNFMSIFVFLAVVFGIYLSRNLWLPHFEGILEHGMTGEVVENDDDDIFPMDISKKVNVKIASMSDCWAMFSDTAITTFDSDGNQIFSSYAPYTNPVLCSSSKRILVYDMGGYSFKVIGRKNEVFSKKLSSQILFAAIGEKGNVAVVTSTDKYTAYLTIYDKNGTEVFHWADGNLITAIDLDDSGNKIIVAGCYASGGSIKTTVTALDLSKTDITAKSAPVSSLCLDLRYTSSGGFWLVGDNALYRYDKDFNQDIYYSYDYDIAGYSMSKDMCAVMFRSLDSKSTYLSLFAVGASLGTNLKFNEVINYIEVVDDLVYYNTATRISAADYSGTVVKTVSLDADYVSFTVRKDEAFLKGYRSINKKEFNG